MKTKNKSIWKFPLSSIATNRVFMPKGAEVLSVQIQDDVICLWALVDPEAEKETRIFGMIGTGDLITIEEAKFIATLQFPKVFGHFNQVYHLFEL